MMMRSIRKPWLGLLLIPTLMLMGCGDDDSPTEPEGTGELSAGAEFFQELSASMNQAAALLFTGGGEVAGQQGKVVVTGSALSFEAYSPDGGTVINGVLTINLLVQPVTVKGQLALTGEQSGTADVSVTIDLTSSPPAYGGIIVLDEVEYDVAEIVAEAQVAGGG